MLTAVTPFKHRTLYSFHSLSPTPVLNNTTFENSCTKNTHTLKRTDGRAYISINCECYGMRMVTIIFSMNLNQKHVNCFTAFNIFPLALCLMHAFRNAKIVYMCPTVWSSFFPHPHLNRPSLSVQQLRIGWR